MNNKENKFPHRKEMINKENKLSCKEEMMIKKETKLSYRKEMIIKKRIGYLTKKS